MSHSIMIILSSRISYLFTSTFDNRHIVMYINALTHRSFYSVCYQGNTYYKHFMLAKYIRINIILYGPRAQSSVYTVVIDIYSFGSWRQQSNRLIHKKSLSISKFMAQRSKFIRNYIIVIRITYYVLLTNNSNLYFQFEVEHTRTHVQKFSLNCKWR